MNPYQNRPYLVECHIPLSFIRNSSLQDHYYFEFAEFRDAINGVNLVPDARRYGKINTSRLLFWIQEIGSLVLKRNTLKWAYFEMYIRFGETPRDVFETLCGLNGPHFFLINIEVEKHKLGGIHIKKFLTPVLMARDYPGYEEAMDSIFGPLEPFFWGNPNPALLPTVSLR